MLDRYIAIIVFYDIHLVFYCKYDICYICFICSTYLVFHNPSHSMASTRVPNSSGSCGHGCDWNSSPPQNRTYLRSIRLHIYAYIYIYIYDIYCRKYCIYVIYACMYIYINTFCFLYLRQLLGTGVMHTDPHGGNLLKVEGSVTKTLWRLMVDDFWGIAFDDTYYYGRLENHYVSKYLFKYLLIPVWLKPVGDSLAKSKINLGGVI